jgi:hypothetical protein
MEIYLICILKLIKEAFEKCIDMLENEKSKFIINNTKLLEITFNKGGIINNLTSQLVGYDDHRR